MSQTERDAYDLKMLGSYIHGLSYTAMMRLSQEMLENPVPPEMQKVPALHAMAFALQAVADQFNPDA